MRVLAFVAVQRMDGRVFGVILHVQKNIRRGLFLQVVMMGAIRKL
jgi:hypothetical protein